MNYQWTLGFILHSSVAGHNSYECTLHCTHQEDLSIVGLVFWQNEIISSLDTSITKLIMLDSFCVLPMNSNKQTKHQKAEMLAVLTDLGDIVPPAGPLLAREHRGGGARRGRVQAAGEHPHLRRVSPVMRLAAHSLAALPNLRFQPPGQLGLWRVSRLR